MQLADAKEIIACLPKGKTPFYYFKDRYALLLLQLAIDGDTSRKELKRGQFAKLLDKDIVHNALRQCRGAKLSPDAFDAVWPARYECYFLTLAIWGSTRKNSWYQTSRTGFNLVLQVNFSSKHDEPYSRLVDPYDFRPFEFSWHPVAKDSFHTLAWARLDIDLTNNEALIEEIQNDWIREALWARRMAARETGPNYSWGSKVENDRLIRYVDNVLRQHEAIWHEATLSAAIWFLRRELGIKNIYFHTHKSGALLKSIRHALPPRSLYSQLPRKFCFKESGDVPSFLYRNTRSRAVRRKLDQARFFFVGAIDTWRMGKLRLAGCYGVTVVASYH